MDFLRFETGAIITELSRVNVRHVVACRCTRLGLEPPELFFRPIGFECQERSNRKENYVYYVHSERRSILKASLSFRSEHPKQTAENGNPAHESYHHGPATHPTIVSADD